MSRQTRRRSYARFRRGRRAVARGRLYRFTSDYSQQYGVSTLGVQSIAFEPECLATGDSYAATSGNRAFAGNVVAMFDRALLEMVAADPHKGIMVPGAVNVQAPQDATTASSGARIGTAVDNTTGVFAGPESASAWHVLTAGGAGNNYPVTSSEYVWTPLNSWKYYPQSVWMRFWMKRRRTFYNPTNTVQTVYVTELRRRRAQYACVDADGVPANVHQDFELLDFQPFGEARRTYWKSVAGEGAMVLFAPEDLATSATELIKIIEAGEMYKKFLYIRFGQYEQLQLQSRGFQNVANRPGGATPATTTLDFNDPRLSYNPIGAETTDPHNPETYGYSNRQAIRDQTTTTLDGLDLTAANDPWYTSTSTSQGSLNQEQDYRYDITFNPLKNPFLKRLFFMRRVKYVLPPGGTATHVFRTSGNVNPLKSHLMRFMHFYSLLGTRDGTGVDDTNRQMPYGLPFPNTYTPPPFVYGSRKRAGWSPVSAIIQVKGQMVFNNPESGASQVMQYGPTRVVAHDKLSVAFRAKSYGKPLVGGTRRHNTFLSVSNDPHDYKSMNPTAAPQSVIPDRTDGTHTHGAPVDVVAIGGGATSANSLNVIVTAPLGTGTQGSAIRTTNFS